MAKVLYLEDYRASVESGSSLSPTDREKREMAKVFICEAVSLLSELGESERSVGWLLEDCAALLEGQSQVGSEA